MNGRGDNDDDGSVLLPCFRGDPEPGVRGLLLWGAASRRGEAASVSPDDSDAFDALACLAANKWANRSVTAPDFKRKGEDVCDRLVSFHVVAPVRTCRLGENSGAKFDGNDRNDRELTGVNVCNTSSTSKFV